MSFWIRHPSNLGLLMLAISPALLALHPLRASQVPLIEGGVPTAAIVVASEPDALESLAATELAHHLRLISGIDYAVTTSRDEAQRYLPIYLGTAADASLDQATRATGDNPSSFTLRVTAERIDIRGLSPEGTLFGVYELLEQIGVRWYMPGEIGRVLPTSDALILPVQQTTQAPSFAYRRLQHLSPDLPWGLRSRLGGSARSTGQHGIPGLGRSLFERHPALFSYRRATGQRDDRQHCLSNPETLARAIAAVRDLRAKHPEQQHVGMAAFDGGGYCECDGCLRLDQGVQDPTGHRASMTDRYIWFFNQILRELEDDFPDLRIVHYTYSDHMMPPAIPMDEDIVPVFAPITLDRIRGMDNPMSADRHLLRWLIEEYVRRGVKEMYYRGYYHNLACPQFPFSQLDRIRNETPVFHRKGITVMRVENIRTSWSSAFLDLYVATRLMWDVDTDIDALLDEFYPRFYGPAADPMRRYHEQLDAAFRDTPFFTGSSFLYLPIFGEHERRAILRRHLDEAHTLTASHEPAIYHQRVAAVRLNWDRLEIWLDMMQARNAHNFARAHELMQRFYELTDEGALADPLEGPHVHQSPRLIHAHEASHLAGSYFNLFFMPAIDSGYQRTVQRGDLVMPVADEWQFLLDPSDIGVRAGFNRPGQLGGNWQSILTSTRSWSDQGLHYYKGVAWYRQRVTVPPEYRNRPIYLWFGGVDGVASVWINGHPVGSSRDPGNGLPGVPNSFKPFDLLVTDAVTFGGDNWIVVRIQNDTLAELGTGGIVAPVMLWSPRDEDWPARTTTDGDAAAPQNAEESSRAAVR